MKDPVTDSQKFTYALAFLDGKKQPTAAPAGATVAYASSNEAVATVATNQDGISGDVTAQLPGTATISVVVTLADGSTVGGSDDVTVTTGADKTVSMTAGPVTEQS